MTVPDLGGLSWRTSSFSSASSANCVEVAFVQEATAVRDSKNRTSPVLLFPAVSWSAARAWLSR